MTTIRIITEEQRDGRFKFLAVYPNRKTNRSLRMWATKREALAAGRREYRVKTP